MTATAERILQECQTLPPPELREVWQTLSEVVNPPGKIQAWDTEAAMEATHSLYARFAGGKGMVRLFQERARDRAREDDKTRRLGQHA